MQLHCRELTLEDALSAAPSVLMEAYAAVPWRECWSRELALARITELLETPGAVAVGAYQGKNLIGIAIGLPHTSAVGRTLYVAELAVVPAFQRRSVGKKLIAFVDAKAFEIGFRSVWLISQGDGTPAKFYLSNGFRLSERLRVYNRPCSAAAPE